MLTTNVCYISYLSADSLIDQSVWELKMNIIRTIKRLHRYLDVAYIRWILSKIPKSIIIEIISIYLYLLCSI